MATRSVGVGEATLVGVKRSHVEPGTVDEAPVFEGDVKSSTVPSRAVAVLVFGESPSNLALVPEGHQRVTKAQLDQAMEESSHSSRFNGLRVMETSVACSE